MLTTHLPDPLEIAELEADEGEESLLSDLEVKTNTLMHVAKLLLQQHKPTQMHKMKMRTNKSMMTIHIQTQVMHHSPTTVVPMIHRKHPTLPLPQLQHLVLFHSHTKLDHNTPPPPPGIVSVLKYFLLVIGDTFFQVLADQTNLYTQQHPPSTSYHWLDTSVEEMFFIGIHLVMELHKLPSVEDYWSIHPLLGAPGVIQGIPIC